ncbi:MAG: di-heme oxidoredictase family protein [Planctomycetota bacterium]
MLPTRALALSVILGGLTEAATTQGDVVGDAARSGGDHTISDVSSNAFGFPSPRLSAAERRAFAVGNAIFRTNWIAAPASANGVDGLGPLFNARSCSACHLRDGRSRPPEADERDRSGLLLRIGIPVEGGGDRGHPIYGGQIQDVAIPGVEPEIHYTIAWEPTIGRYADGTEFELVEPRYELRAPAYGPLGDDFVLGARVAPHLVGLGLLEAIPADAIASAADPADRDGDGIRGRVHRLPGSSGAIGRFGWKATQGSVHGQTAAAFVHDMGITSPEHPREPLSAVESEAIARESEAGPDIDAHKLARVVFYARSIAVPAQRDAAAADVIAGSKHFEAFGCAICHRPTWTTGADENLAPFDRQTIHPYTDLLLHDLGPDLADGKHDGDAKPSEWRTPPLWGIGLIPVVNGHERLLHDGRARGFAEAVLWHGGEAEASRERFRNASASEREQLIAFLRSL